jgi:predicted transcriptional regulator
MSKWQIALAVLSEKFTQGEIAGLLAASESAVSKWARGEHQPRKKHRRLLVELAHKHLPNEMRAAARRERETDE